MHVHLRLDCDAQLSSMFVVHQEHLVCCPLARLFDNLSMLNVFVQCLHGSKAAQAQSPAAPGLIVTEAALCHSCCVPSSEEIHTGPSIPAGRQQVTLFLFTAASRDGSCLNGS